MTKPLFLVVLFVSLSAMVSMGQTKPVVADTITDYYEVQTIPMPAGLTAETGAMAFLPDGRLIACFHRGEVMMYTPKTKTWKLFAEGLHDPLGILVISNRELLIMQRPELTRLKDTDGDGVADVYETVTDQFGLSGNYHEFAFGPVRDKQGNLYIGLNAASSGAGIRDELRGRYEPLGRQGKMYSCVPYRGWIMRLTPDGKLLPFACGFRSPNGMFIDAKDRLFVTDNQGDWLGTSKLYHVEQGKFYGHPPSLVWKEGFPDVDPTTLPPATLDSMRVREMIAFPHQRLAHSPTQIVVDNTGGRFGPFAGQMLVGEMDFSRLLRILPDEVNGQLQGAAIPFFDNAGLRKGNNRLVFAPDGSLWLGQTDHGWAGDRGIQRLVYKGGTLLDVMAMHLTPTGFELTFTQPLDEASAKALTNYQFRRFYYKYHASYGSPETDSQPVPVTAVTLSPDRKSVSLTLNELKPNHVYELMLGDLRSAGKRICNRMLYYTLNQLKQKPQ
ncbi:hypothetical protein GCM10023189_47090 [Nibrella saemangeumensis]|uniref:DUF7133 domain-containing protein n=1 Tax=Nibrella saemangeumensis TaxID=1084526 RepID=A0ABP8NHA3_9BACT